MSTPSGTNVRAATAVAAANGTAHEWGRVLLDEQHQGVIALSGQMEVLLATPAAAQLLGRPVEAGMSLHELLDECFEVEPRALTETSIDMRERRCHELERGVEFQVDGRWLLARLNPRGTSVKISAGALLWLFDITDLHGSLDRRTESLRFLSHDLRSPQNSIVALTQLHEHDPQAFEAFGGMQRIAELARYALSLGDQFIFTSVSGALQQRDFVRFDLGAALRSVIPKLEVAAVYRNVALHLWLAEGPAVWVSGAKVFVMRALQNLIDNAIHASRAGARVTVSLKITNEDAVIVVCDEAGGLPGLSPDKPLTNFDGLSRKASGGYGIGLKLAARIVALHGGTLHAQVNRNDGTDFVMRLPRLALRAGTRAAPDDGRSGLAAFERPPPGWPDG